MKIEEMGEVGLIKRLTKSLPRDEDRVMVGPGDDAAVIRIKKGTKLALFTIDALIEGIHFTLGALTPYQIGWKALAVNLSDIAAMGGIPQYALVSLGLKSGTSAKFVDGLYRGIKALARKYGVSVVGGDTVQSPQQLTLTIALLGEVEQKYFTRRSGARIGDKILVTGSLGASAAHRLKGQYLPPQPRVEEARAIVKKFKPTSMIDLSDGLASDLRHICEASQVGAEIRSGKIPLSRRTRRLARGLGQDPLPLALEGGEDYELLFTLPQKRIDKLIAQIEFPVSLIGEITEEKEKILLVDKNNHRHPLEARGYEHFGRASSF
ncbi:thiamine-phosphate kinase [candidate division NPL-UPA2 bacterium]|nr:thiamine-phosphate kinase [candidate division NPL-UPA2 bacterium]